VQTRSNASDCKSLKASKKKKFKQILAEIRNKIQEVADYLAYSFERRSIEVYKFVGSIWIFEYTNLQEVS
jgi:hypothetical protein